MYLALLRRLKPAIAILPILLPLQAVDKQFLSSNDHASAVRHAFTRQRHHR
jgi:hypothetical protein